MPSKRPISRLLYDDKRTKKKAPVLTPLQLKKLFFVVSLSRNPERNRLILWLLFGAGFRITEVAQIRVKDVLWKSGKVRTEVVIPAKFTKTGQAGHVFFYNKKLQYSLQDYVTLRREKRKRASDNAFYGGLQPNSPLILSETGTGYSLKRKVRKNVDDKEVSYRVADTLQEMVTRWGREAGITGFSTHSGRRTFATRLERKGIDDGVLCALLRHTTDEMPYEYVDEDVKLTRAIIEDMHADVTWECA